MPLRARLLLKHSALLAPGSIFSFLVFFISIISISLEYHFKLFQHYEHNKLIEVPQERRVAPYLSSMMNGTSSRVSVRPAQGIGKASPMSKSPSSLKEIPKTSKDGKGTVSNTVSKQSKPKKVKSQKQVDFVTPKFDSIKGVNCCVNCKKGNHLTDSIVCQLCNTSFHALARQCQVQLLMIQRSAHRPFLQVYALSLQNMGPMPKDGVISCLFVLHVMIN